MAKSGLNKLEIALMKKHVDAGTPVASIRKVFKGINQDAVESFYNHFASKGKKAEKPVEKKATAKKQAAKKVEPENEDDDEII